MWNRLLIPALVIWLIASVCALVARPLARPIVPREGRVDAAWTVRPVAGFSMQLYHTNQIDLYIRSIDELAEHGFDSVQIVAPIYQADVTASELRIDVSPGRCPRRADLVHVLRHAKDRHMRTALMPVVLPIERKGNDWRGVIQPGRPSDWWRSYQQTMDYFVDVAIDADVDALCVGSELVSMQDDTKEWLTLIERCRSKYDGLLYYSANWDRFRQPAFWPHLDLIGVNAYFDLTAGAASGASPSPEQLASRWRTLRDELLTFAGAQEKPVLLTEVGYPSQAHALTQPWNYVDGAMKQADHDAQAKGYAAFLTAWHELSPGEPWAGVYFYDWDPTRTGGRSDTGYGVRGKPALELLRSWLRERPRVEPTATP